MYKFVVLLLIPMLGLAALDGPVFSITPHKIDGLWLGYYSYDSGKIKPVAITVVLKTINNNEIVGDLIEVNTFGPTDSTSLTSIVNGKKQDTDFHITFTYDGRNKVSHSVENKLHFTDDGKELIGIWNIGKEWTGKIGLKKIMDSHREVFGTKE